MKRWLALAISVSLVLLTLFALPVSAEGNQTNDWSVYIMEETEGGFPMFKDPPAYEYGDRGLRVTPEKGMASYTVQSDTPYSLEDGFYLELEVEDVSLENTLMIHLWDQSGVLMGNYNCGSGWYTMISMDEDGNDYMMSLNVRESSGTSSGSADILGSMKVNTSLQGKVGRYSISVKDGILRLNGSAVPGLDEAMAFLRETNPDGAVYVGVTIMSFEDSPRLSPMTLTRFGADATTAVIPGTNIVPETKPAESAPVESDTQTPSEDTVASDTAPETEPDETLTRPSDTDAPIAETETASEVESETVSPLDQLKDVYGVASARCHSTVGLSGLGYVAAIALGGLLLRKKKD